MQTLASLIEISKITGFSDLFMISLISSFIFILVSINNSLLCNHDNDEVSV
jgi:hypothetical protein